MKFVFSFLIAIFSVGCISLNEHEALVSELSKRIDLLSQENQKLKQDRDTAFLAFQTVSLDLEVIKTQKQKLAESLKKEIENGKVRISQQNDKIILNIDNKICFPSGSAVLGAEAKEILSKLVTNLKEFKNNKVYIEGNTDNVPVIKNSWVKDNWALSAERACSVTRFLETYIEPERFSIVGHSYFNSLVPNNTEENKHLNRRVDIIIIKEK
jgi:chemotaxis protein MotB